MKLEQVDAIAQGRVWTGEQALPLKLVDSIGGFDDAMAAAKAMAHFAAGSRSGSSNFPSSRACCKRCASGWRRHGAAPAARIAEPVYQMIRAALSGRGLFSAVYCPVVPML